MGLVAFVIVLVKWDWYTKLATGPFHWLHPFSHVPIADSVMIADVKYISTFF